MIAKLPADGAGAWRMRHGREQCGAPSHLIEQRGPMSEDALAVFADGLGEREEAHKGGGRVKVKGQRRRDRPQACDRHGAKEPDRDAGEQNAGRHRR